MKVAIIGAGISGLACAHELKRQGIIPVIFDRKDSIGEAFDLNVCTLKLFHKPIRDPITYLKKRYGLTLHPLDHLRELTLTGPNTQTTITGRLGYIFKRGKEDFSLTQQLYQNIQLPLTMNTHIHHVDELKKGFDYIVVATGNEKIANELALWTPTLKTYARIATVLGDFNTGTVQMWFNTRYAKHCFGYIIANSPKEAQLILIVDGIPYRELDSYWKEFLFSEDLRYQITEFKDIEYNTGFTTPVQMGNVYFVGNAAGITDDFFGFGLLNSIHSGVLAARAIAKNKSYASLLHPLLEERTLMHEYRKQLDRFENEDYDRLISSLDIPTIQRFVYTSPHFSAKKVARLLRLYHKITLR